MRARGTRVLPRVRGSIHGSRECCRCRWEFPGHHPPVPAASLVLSASSRTPQPVAFPAMWCIQERLEELRWDPRGWDMHSTDTGRDSMSLFTAAPESG